MTVTAIALWVLAVVLVLVGLVGTVLPVLPGALLVFAGLISAAWADGFERVGWPSIALMGVLAVLSYGVDFAAGALGAKKLGGSTWGVVGAVFGTFVGLFFGLAGLILGPFLGAVAGEYANRRQLDQAGRAGAGAWLGMVVGTAAKLAFVAAMIGVFVLGYFL